MTVTDNDLDRRIKDQVRDLLHATPTWWMSLANSQWCELTNRVPINRGQDRVYLRTVTGGLSDRTMVWDQARGGETILHWHLPKPTRVRHGAQISLTDLGSFWSMIEPCRICGGPPIPTPRGI